jgi:dTDP-4-amino-4,6-dideoxygalactose transaminase
MINVTKPYLPDVEKYKKYVEKIFCSGWITNNGPMVQELEEKLSEYLGVKNVLLVSNGTLALQLAYKILNIKGEVLTTPFTFVATTSSIVWEGLNPVFVDIDDNTLNMDYRKIQKSITKDTTCIVPVHVFGNACEVEKIEEIATKNNLKVIYDAAHAFGVEYNGKSILNYGDISILSFHATKVFHTIEGGALIIKSDDLFKKAKNMINFGITDQGRIEELGINLKMNEFEAAMGLCILDDIKKIINNREKIYYNYMNKLSKLNQLKFQIHNENSSLNYSYFPILLESEEKLLEIELKLKEEDIFPRRYFYPSLNNLSYLDTIQYMPVSDNISKRILCLPIYDSLSLFDQDRIINIVSKNL